MGNQSYTYIISVTSHSQNTQRWDLSHLQITCWSIMQLLCCRMWLGEGFHSSKFPGVTCNQFMTVATDKRAPNWITTNLWGTCDKKKRSSYELVTHHRNRQVPWNFNGHGTCRFRWQVPPSYCKYSGVTYVGPPGSNMGGTLNLSKQLTSTCHFDHFVVNKAIASPSGVRCKPINIQAERDLHTLSFIHVATARFLQGVQYRIYTITTT